MLDEAQGGWTLEAVRAKFAWMVTRIQVPQAQEWARPLYEVALEHLNQKEAAMGCLGPQVKL